MADNHGINRQGFIIIIHHGGIFIEILVRLVNVKVLAPSIGEDKPMQVASPDSAILIT